MPRHCSMEERQRNTFLNHTVQLMRLKCILTCQCHVQECEYVKMNHSWRLLLMVSMSAAAMNAES